MFKKSRRIPRKIGRDDDEAEATASPSVQAPDDEPSSTVKRPAKESRLSKAKKAHQASVRTSFAPNDDDEHDEQPPQARDEDPFARVERKKAAANANRASLASARLPYRSPDSPREAPSYSADYLASLKSAQQHTPKPARYTDADAPSDSSLTSTTRPPQSSTLQVGPSTQTAQIPSATEIAEKKARRARLAAEERAEDYLALSDHSEGSASDASDGLITRAKERDLTTKPESRLGAHALDDDDFGEDLEGFTEPTAALLFDKKARREAKAARRADIAAQIAGAEGDELDGDALDDEEIEPDERARLRAYEKAQTRAGTYGERHTATNHRARERDRDRETRHRRRAEMEYVPCAAPELKSALARFQALVEAQRARREGAERALEEVRREREEILGEEERVQGLVREAGERLERVSGPGAGKEGVDVDVPMQDVKPADGEESEEDEVGDEEDEDEAPASGLGSSMQAGLGGLNSLADRPTSFAGMGAPPSPEW